MAFTEFERAMAEVALEKFLAAERTEESPLDGRRLSYRIENQSVYICELKPHFVLPEDVELKTAKATYVRSRKLWKVFWMRADLKWHAYYPQPEVRSIDEFLEAVEEDSDCCFWG